jgi:hypothetical protein
VEEFGPHAFAPEPVLESKKSFAYSDMYLNHVHGQLDPNGASLNSAVEFATAGRSAFGFKSIPRWRAPELWSMTAARRPEKSLYKYRLRRSYNPAWLIWCESHSGRSQRQPSDAAPQFLDLLRCRRA